MTKIDWLVGMAFRADGSYTRYNFVTGQTIHHSPPCDHAPTVHFVGFRGDEYNRAVKIWGKPGYIHMGWDLRARRDVCLDCDTVVFARGEHDQEPAPRTFNDLQPTPEEIEERRLWSLSQAQSRSGQCIS